MLRSKEWPVGSEDAFKPEIDPYCTFASKGQCDQDISCFLCHDKVFSKLSIEHSKLISRIEELDGFVEALAVCRNMRDTEDIIVNQINYVLRDSFEYPKKEEVEEVIECPRINLCSSHGTISFDESGMDPITPEGQPWSYLNEITQLDIVEWKYMYPGEDITEGEHDILDIAYWDIYSMYEAAEKDWRLELAEMRNV